MFDLLNKFKFYLMCFRFRSLRGEFYTDFSRTMSLSQGNNLRSLLEVQAERHKGRVVGYMCALWVERLLNDASTFASAVAGTIPHEDLVLIEVCESSGDLPFGLAALGKNLLSLKKTIQNIRQIASLALTMLVLTLGYFFLQAFSLLPDMFKNLGSSLDIHKIGETTDNVLAFMEFWQSFGWLIVLGIIGLVILMFYSFKNWTGELRQKADKYFFPYQLYSGFNAALFLSTLAALTQRIGSSNVLSLESALQRINRDSYPWLRSHIDRVIQNLNDKPTSGGEVFNTGLMSERIYFRVLDMSDYIKDTAQLMTAVSEIILEETPVLMEKKVLKFRVVLQFTIAFLMVSFWVSTGAVNDEFNTAMEIANMK